MSSPLKPLLLLLLPPPPPLLLSEYASSSVSPRLDISGEMGEAEESHSSMYSIYGDHVSP